MARYAREGVDVLVVTLTDGSRGSVLNPAMDRPEVVANITEVRAAEMERAREILGVRQVFMGFVDSGLPEGDPLPPLPDGCFARVDLDEAVAPLVEVIRRFRPHVLTTYDENGGYPHPDHIMCHKISVAAFDAAADPDAYPELGAPWQTLKLYYSFTFHRARMVALDRAMTERGIESPYADRLREWPEDPDQAARVTTRVPCAEYFDIRDRALLAHATQVDPEGPWFSVPLDLHKSVWPTEDWQRVRSLVDAPLPEDDLFAGIAVPVDHADLASAEAGRVSA
jgi:mycothiol S-conjugate amidase